MFVPAPMVSKSVTVDHYDALLALDLTEAEKGYLVDYLRSL
jgi:hypothetical protein